MKTKYTRDPVKNRAYKLKLAFGITIEEWEELYRRQSGRCAVCGIHSVELSRRLSVDHDHETGEVRGLLCSKCNRGIGFMKDSPELLILAANYLQSYEEIREEPTAVVGDRVTTTSALKGEQHE